MGLLPGKNRSTGLDLSHMDKQIRLSEIHSGNVDL